MNSLCIVQNANANGDLYDISPLALVLDLLNEDLYEKYSLQPQLLKKEVGAWTKKRNMRKEKINWTFTKEIAKKKMAKYLPNN